MRYSRASRKVLEMMRKAVTEAGRSPISTTLKTIPVTCPITIPTPAIMTSGNSPFVTPRARYNFLSRSVRSKQHLRPSLLGSSVASQGIREVGRSLSSGSVPESTSDLSSLDSGSCSLAMMTPPQSQPRKKQFKAMQHAAHGTGITTATCTPTRPRHVKYRNQLQKHTFTTVSLCSVNSDTCSSGCSVGSSSPENSRYHNGTRSKEDGDMDKEMAADTISMLSGCVERVTLVSVPDNQVITQGANHQCAHPNHGRKGAKSVAGVSVVGCHGYDGMKNACLKMPQFFQRTKYLCKFTKVKSVNNLIRLKVPMYKNMSNCKKMTDFFC